MNGTPIETIPAADYARKLAVLAQRHLQMAAELSVRDVVLMGRYPYKERFQSYGKHDHEVVENVMCQFRILPMATKKIGQLSGGELQRVFVAKALAQEPEVLLLDEPTNHLDVKYKIALMEELRRFDGTVVIVLHDLGLAARYCDHAAVLRAGEVVAEGAAQDVLVPALLEDVFEVPFYTSEQQGTRYLYY
ncbi:ABC transporter ATP-binding protein, partial [Selenomonas sp. F0473]|uniref:ABC transporter ATP-binding protein n=1 Tax=Selenomonas sp. F0473 TaxID=999423 RepID=UPI0025FAEF47